MRQSTVFTPLERDVREYAAAMNETPPRVTDGLADRLLVQRAPRDASAVVEAGRITRIYVVANLQELARLDEVTAVSWS